MNLIRIEVRKIGTKKWYGLFQNPWNECVSCAKYYDLSRNLNSPHNYVPKVPKEWKFYFTEDGYRENLDLITFMENQYAFNRCQYRIMEIKDTNRLKKRNFKILDPHQAVIWKGREI